MNHAIARSSTATLLLLASITAPLVSQDAAPLTARGVVLDATTGEPVPGAYVGLKDSRIGTATNSRGEFVLPDLPHGATIEVTQLGYVDVVLEVESSDPLRIEIAANPIVMEGLAVVADRLAHRWRASGVAARTYTAEQIISAPAATALDFAYMRAALGRCPAGYGDCVWRRGSWRTPSIHIDDLSYGSDTGALLGIASHDIHAFTVVGGTSIHVFTKHFAERAALGRRMMPARW